MNKKILLITISLLFMLSGCKKELMCDDGYSLNGELCYKEVTRINATEEYSCNDSYVFNKETNKCETLETIDAKQIYTCKSGYTLNGNMCTGVASINANVTYNCDGVGGTLEGSKCISKVIDTKALVCVKKYCLSGTYDSQIGKCKSVAPFTGNVTYHSPVCEYACARGTMKNNVCYVDYASNANVTYSCNSGYILNGSKCSKNVTIDAITKYECQEGYTLKNNKCERIVESDKITNYRCESNYQLNGNECVLYDVKNAILK